MADTKQFLELSRWCASALSRLFIGNSSMIGRKCTRAYYVTKRGLREGRLWGILQWMKRDRFFRNHSIWKTLARVNWIASASECFARFEMFKAFNSSIGGETSWAQGDRQCVWKEDELPLRTFRDGAVSSGALTLQCYGTQQQRAVTKSYYKWRVIKVVKCKQAWGTWRANSQRDGAKIFTSILGVLFLGFVSPFE